MLSLYDRLSPEVAEGIFVAHRSEMSLGELAQLALATPDLTQRQALIKLIHDRVIPAADSPENAPELTSEERDERWMSLAQEDGLDATRVLQLFTEEAGQEREAGLVAAGLIRVIAPGSPMGWTSSTLAGQALATLGEYAAAFELESTPLPQLSLVGGEVMQAQTDAGNYQTYRCAIDALRGQASGADLTLQFEPAEESAPFYFTIASSWSVPLTLPDSGSGEGEPSVAHGDIAAVHRRYELLSGAELHEGEAIERGEIVRVRLYVNMDQTLSALQLIDPLPASLVAIQPPPGTSPTDHLLRSLGMEWSEVPYVPELARTIESMDYQTQTYERNAVVFRITTLSPGLWEFSYLVRATTPGDFIAAPAQLEDVSGEPLAFGASDRVSVTDSSE